jgi:uncharacterized protein YaiI (UPF0178 family)
MAETQIFLDADACPVKEEAYRVARRYGLHVHVVANSFIRAPREATIHVVVVDAGPDVADDWIAERAGPGDIIITSDIPLAERGLKAGADVLAPTGRAFTTASIGAALAQRAVMEHLRSFGEGQGGPKPFGAPERSRFLSALDAAVVRARKSRPGGRA